MSAEYFSAQYHRSLSDTPASASASAEGFVSLVGAGPGDPELLTLRAFQRLQQAQVVVYDALLDRSFSQFFPGDAELIYAGKRAGHHTLEQEEINALLVNRAQRGLRVVRLKGGDPGVFGRGGEEALALLEAGLPFEVVPGVSSLNGAAAAADISLTHRGLSDGILALHGQALLQEPWRWSGLALAQVTLAVFMAAGKSATVARLLLDLGCAPDLPLALVENATQRGQRTQHASLAEAAAGLLERGTTGPGILFVGETARGWQGILQSGIPLQLSEKTKEVGHVG